MSSHVAIRRESYVAGTRERREVGIFPQTHTSRRPTPRGRLAVGEPDPKTPFNPSDDRIVSLGLHVDRDATMGHSVDVGMWWRSASD